ncbi:hypothetical protein BKA93DRAFT_537108 [Sparassis latifolia]|uniref:Carbohydrate-binding module family 19 domain-containing protein n=1 Tax=Sparassis crispa TaxID=139825 RepID=A0A401G8I7_9APHY|nr:hypothetical protein SCP_0113700 [Sparassis crispa]GBE78481.1 hypothetical protein SCP_0113700 [Sparassis crispa]
MKLSVYFAVLVSTAAFAAPAYVSRAGFALQNGEKAIALNNQFKTLTANSSCTSGDIACVNSEFAQCVNGQYVLHSCGTTLICAALPLVNSEGTSVTCTTQGDLDARIAATGATNGTSSPSAVSSVAPVSSASAVSHSTSKPATTASAVTSVAPSAASASAVSSIGSDCSGSAVSSSVSAATPTASAVASQNNGTSSGNSTDPQSSSTLLQSVIATGFENNGQDQPQAGQVPSQTSSNNFINFCATVPQLPITNGQQIKNGSCNPAPMGIIASTNNMPSAKFVFPANMGTVKANTNFTVTMAISNLATGFFVNADENYFAAPQTTDSAGNVKGHSHLVIERLNSLNQTTPTNPSQFAFFKGLNDAAQNGTLTAQVTGGLPAGVYRMASINSAANHQPVLVAVAQHGTLDDMIYFTAQ